VSIAPFGWPVVPDVKMMSETVLPVTAASRRSISCSSTASPAARNASHETVPAGDAPHHDDRPSAGTGAPLRSMAT
jgi:hypothetical protein